MKWVLALLCLALVAPLALVDVPPLLDYPNHLARAVVLAAGAADPILSRMYAARWEVIPNLGLDLLLPPLLHVLPVHVAGRLVLGLAVLLPVAGTIAYSRATFRTAALWPLASVLVAYNATFLLGFINFLIGIGGALLLAAGWIAWRDRYPGRTLALAMLGTVALFFCHLMGLVFFYILIVGHELHCVWPRRHASPKSWSGLAPRSGMANEERVFPGWHHPLRRFAPASPASGRGVLCIRGALLAPLIVVSLGLYLISPLAPVSEPTEWSSPLQKGMLLVLPFANYVLPLDIATAAIVIAFVLGCLASGYCRITPGSGIALALTMLLFLGAPWAFKGTFFLDARFGIMLGFLLFGGLLPTGLPRRIAVPIIAGFAAVFVVRMAVVSHAWYQHQHDLRDLRQTIAAVEPGARVLVATVEPTPDYWVGAPVARRLSLDIRLDHHLPALLLIERRAYWPFLFDNASQQPVETRSPYRELAARTAAIADHHAIAVPGKVDLCGFDYVLLLEAGADPDVAHFATDRLMLLTRSDIAALYRIRATACVSS